MHSTKNSSCILCICSCPKSSCIITIFQNLFCISTNSSQITNRLPSCYFSCIIAIRNLSIRIPTNSSNFHSLCFSCHFSCIIAACNNSSILATNTTYAATFLYVINTGYYNSLVMALCDNSGILSTNSTNPAISPKVRIYNSNVFYRSLHSAKQTNSLSIFISYIKTANGFPVSIKNPLITSCFTNSFSNRVPGQQGIFHKRTILC